MLYLAAKQDGISVAHAASVFRISGGKLAVQIIVLGGSYYNQLLGFTPRIMIKTTYSC